MQTLCSWIYKKICFNSTAYYKAKIQLNSHSANLNFSSWGICLARCPWDTLIDAIMVFFERVTQFRRLEVNRFQPCKKLSRLVCALCRKTEQNSNIAIFQQLIFAMAELGEGADCSLQFRRLCLKGYHLCLFIHISLFWSIWSLICSFSLLWHILLVIRQLEIQKCPLMLLFLC